MPTKENSSLPLLISPRLEGENNREYAYRVLRQNIITLQFAPGQTVITFGMFRAHATLVHPEKGHFVPRQAVGPVAGDQQAEERDGGLAAGKGDLEHAALGHGLFAGRRQNVGGSLGHGGGVFVNMHGKMDGTAAALHVRLLA